ncbi:hypothetical protein FACS189430_09720 [Bacteroidia bacterium]|nr:hypothetical protein FACS189430_09720 [Bacteroidia bacterium]
MKTIIFLGLVLAGVGTSGCDNNSSDKNETVVCNDIESGEIIEIKNLETKLYFISEYPDDAFHVMAVFDKDGLRYNLSNKTAGLFKGFTNNYTVCNFPDYAVGWNPKYWNGQSYSVIVEGEVDVVISGKYHIFSKTEGERQNILVINNIIKKEIK